MKNVRLTNVKTVDKLPPVHLSLRGPGEGQESRFDGPEYMQRYLAAIQANGGLFSRAQAAAMLDVSVSRVGQLVRENRLRVVTLDIETPAGVIPGEETIPGRDIAAWLAAPKNRGGRGKKIMPELTEAMAA